MNPLIGDKMHSWEVNPLRGAQRQEESSKRSYADPNSGVGLQWGSSCKPLRLWTLSVADAVLGPGRASRSSRRQDLVLTVQQILRIIVAYPGANPNGCSGLRSQPVLASPLNSL